MPGSSPLARGLLRDLRRTASQLGIIPARAGFTRWHYYAGSQGTDHPRSRGVYYGEQRTSAWTVGSSPLARGLPPHALALMMAHRIIPARAGFTFLSDTGLAEMTDHPRSRGVYVFPPVPVLDCEGSSPLARGLPYHVDVLGVGRGIIPARAGFTSWHRA